MRHCRTLQTLSEKTLQNAVQANLVAHCPSMDLLALVTKDQQVFIYRLNGQRVYGAAQRAGKLQIQNLRWQPNGQLLAIAWSDGSIRIIGVESAKVVHQFSTSKDVIGITCMGWWSNITHKTASARTIPKSSQLWHPLLEDQSDDSKDFLDLPRDLSLIDIEISLPKLSPLTLGSTSEDVFSSRTSLDALFRPFMPNDNNTIDVLVVGTQEGRVHLTIYDSFVVGSFPSPAVINGVPSQLILHASHESCSTYSLLMRQQNENVLYFVQMDLRFILASSDYLSLLASRSTALQNLLRYVDQTQRSMIAEWKSTQELPSRFQRSINETLTEKGLGDIIQALYHSVATGHTFPCVREWLVDDLSERGHKRWDKAVTTGLDNLKRLVHENMLPALDRCAVILSRFAGIAKFQGPNDAASFQIKQVNILMETVACLHLLSSKVLIRVVDEIELFASFSSWLRYEIDRLASDSSSSISEDTAEKESLIDHSKVLLYLQSAMINSPLNSYLSEVPSIDKLDDQKHSQESPITFHMLDKQIQKYEQGLSIKYLPSTDQVCGQLNQQAKLIFDQLAEAEKRNVLFGRPYKVGVTKQEGAIDMIMSSNEAGIYHSYIVYVPDEHPHSIRVVRITLKIEKAISTVQHIKSSEVQLGDGQVKDLKFTDDYSILILWETANTTSILSIYYDKPSHTEENSDDDDDNDTTNNEYYMRYALHDQNGLHPPPTIFQTNDVASLFEKFKIPTSTTSTTPFVPEKIHIRNQGLKRTVEDLRRIVLLSKDGMHYRVFMEAEAEGDRAVRDGTRDNREADQMAID